MTKSYETEHPNKAFGWAARDSSGVLSPFNFSRRYGFYKNKNKKTKATRENDVQFKVLYCGICHSDLHMIKNEWGNAKYPIVPGCTNDLEQYCPSHIGTYGTTYFDETTTYGGYSDLMVAKENFVFRWPENLPMEAAPLLCAGITTYRPLKYFGLDKPGLNIGVVGLGGLGHMAVKFAKAFGCNVTVIST
ncbi:8-hydroxygeraniol dehydrogenase [Datura stramonium]|uniref:8-hydroxygeraniol dehydrogenase n=1 Tax=Datura stramonium TaxID=4076 RepID=A0ABS8STN9_DATST|nr:8-hydroxygeraniol dehydrogenase [Datura stramonium]